ncbi:MAG: CHAD domain-containing protein [Kiloniellales bacterium]
MKEEIELKLALTPKSLKRIRSHPLLRTLASGRRAQRQELQSSYFDTPDRSLRAQGIALRVRKKGNKLIQTVKAPLASAYSGLQHVQEFETEATSALPDLSLLPAGDVRETLEALTLASPLECLFETRIVRHVLPVRLIESEIEIAFDEGKVVAGDRELAICEVELELLSGSAQYLLQLGMAIGEQVPFRLELRSKAARGYLLAEETVLPAVLSDGLAMPKQTTAGEAFEIIARNCLGQIRGNEAAFRSGNRKPEVVHQLRVGVRRLRAAVSIFEDLIADGVLVQLKEELSWLQNALGPARDWDVFRDETLAPILHRMPDEPCLQRLGVAAERFNAEAYEQAEESLDSHRYAMLLLRLDYWLLSGSWRSLLEAGEGPGYLADGPAVAFSKIGLAKRARQVLKRGKERDEEVEESLHELRISGKKLRYALEFFRAFMKKEDAKAAIRLTKELQDCLGSLNDAAVSKGLLESLATRFPDEVEPRALGIVLGWQARRVEDDLGHLQGVWGHAKERLKQLK